MNRRRSMSPTRSRVLGSPTTSSLSRSIGDRTGAMTFQMSKNFVALELTPLQIRRFQLVRPSSHDIQWLGQKLDQESQRFDTRIELTAEETFSVSWPGQASS